MNLSNTVDLLEYKLLKGEIRSKNDLFDYLNEIGYKDKSDSVYLEMKRRKTFLDINYPFTESDGLFSPDRDVSIEDAYVWLLLISLKSNDNHILNASILDSLSIQALKNYFGSSSNFINFSFPLRYGSKRPSKFQDAIKYLGTELGLDTCVGYKIPNRKDGGVDLVVYNSILGTKALNIFLVQTTTKIDYFDKINDIDIKLWQNWINLGPDPTRMLISSMAATDNDLNTAHSSGIVFIDRLRLLKLISQSKSLLTFDNEFLSLFKKHFEIDLT